MSPFIIFSLDRPEISDKESEFRRERATALLERRGLIAVRAVGYWQGQPERSIVARLPVGDTERAERLIRRLCALFGQDAYLYITERRQALLVSPDSGKVEPLGKLKASARRPDRPGYTELGGVFYFA